MPENNETNNGLKKYMSPLGAWAFSFGAAVGWGAFVMPGTLFLPVAGPLGTALGIAIGAVVMMLIGVNYHFMIKRFPDCGGTYTYTKKMFGYDHGFLSAWFILLTYIAVLWANATALSLIVRCIFGDIFKFGFHYSVWGYEVYFGEILLSAAAIVIPGFICMYLKKTANMTQIIAALILAVGAIVVFAVVFTGKASLSDLKPDFSPENSPAISVFGIMALAPWAFIGFESVSNSAGEFKFKPKLSMVIMAAAVTTAAVVYIVLAQVAASLRPEGYADWTEYVSDLSGLSGFEGIPTFFATFETFGNIGIVIIAITVLGGILTGIVANYTAVSRLLYSMSKDRMLPSWFSYLTKNGTPKNAVLFIMILSLIIPFFGRTAIGWIVDVTTVGASIAYGYTSAAAFKAARDEKKKPVMVTGVIGVVMSCVFILYLMVPNFWSVSGLSTESYLILAVWAILGFVVFRIIFSRDRERRLGKSTIVWISMLFLIFMTTLLWVRQATHTVTNGVVENISEYYITEYAQMGVVRSEDLNDSAHEYMQEQMEVISDSLLQNSIVQMILIILALAIMFNVYSIISKREKEMEVQKVKAEDSNKAKSTFLSNMSHDIRTPMNAIIGYTTLAKKEKDITPQIEEYLEKIETSSQHLLALINDVLEMSRIESGKMDIEPVKVDIVHTLEEVRDMFATQMVMKSINYTVDINGVKDRIVMCDKNRLNRVLLNLISNAYKFTPEGGRINVSLRQRGQMNEKGIYEIHVKDSGIGMSPEFAAHVFEAFEREKTSTVSGIQGTGLGMAITKSIVDLMGGTIEVHTVQGEGTDFEIRLFLDMVGSHEAEKSEDEEEKTGEENTASGIDFSGKRILLVEDNPINQEIAKAILLEAGFVIETADNGKEAVDMVEAASPCYYEAILMDVQMPVMGGYEATAKIRALNDKKRASVPIIAMTANAFVEDIAEAKEAGMDAHVAKPIDIPKLMGTLSEVLKG